MTGDFDGDGRTDILIIDKLAPSTGTIYDTIYRVYSLRPSGSTLAFKQIMSRNGWLQPNSWENTNQFMVADTNGDGRSDIIEIRDYASPVEVITWLASVDLYGVGDDKTQFALGATSFPNIHYLNGDRQYYTADINGDGRSDLLIRQAFIVDSYLSSEGGTQLDYSNTTYLSTTGGAATWNSIDWIVPLDVNGDGKTDFAVWGSDSNIKNAMQVWISTGSGFITSPDSKVTNVSLARGPNEYKNLGTANCMYLPVAQRVECSKTGIIVYARSLLVRDVNGDGLADIVETGDKASPLTTVWLSDGSKYVQSSSTDLHNASTISSYFLEDVNGDAKGDIIRVMTANNVATVTASMSPKKGDLITSATNGLDQTTTIEYQPLTNNAIYKSDLTDNTTANDAVYPNKETQDSTYVVASVTSPSGASQQYLASNSTASSLSVTKYTYEGRREHLRGRGDLGFRVLKITAPNGVVSTTYNKQDFPFTGSPYQVDVSQPNGWLLSQSLNSYAQVELGTSAFAGYLGNKRYIAYSGSTSLYSYELDKKEISHVITTSDPPDVDGNTKKVKIESSDGFVKTTESVFYPSDYANWQFGLVATTSMASTMPGAFSVTGQALTGTRKVAFVYDTTGRLKTEIVEPDTFDVASQTFTWGNSTVVTNHSYDAWGIKSESTVTGLDYVIGPDVDVAGKVKLDSLTQKPLERIISGTGAQVSRRTSKSSYVESGDFATVTSWNAKDHKETQTIDLRFGVPTSSTGPNGLTTQWYYDAFGRKVREVRADGTYSDTEYLDCSVCPSHVATPKYRVKSTSSTSTAVAYAYYDLLGRVITTESQGLNNETIYKDAYYDDYGRVWKSTNAYYANNPVGKTESITTYNAILGRVESGSMPDESQPDSTATVSTSTAYSVYSYFDSTSGSTVTIPRVVITDSNNHNRVEEHNTEGKLVETTDALGSTVKYRYDAFGNLVVVENQGYDGVKLPSIITGYDSRGRKIYMQDPDMGQWQYGYNTFGELKWQQDAKGQVVTMDYDVLGRMVKRSEPEGASTWTYDTAPHGIGKVAQEVGFKGQAVGGSSSFTYPPARSYVYDGLGRPALVGIALNGEMYTMYSAYDASGRLESTTYPGVNGERFSVKRNFNSLGYVTNITDGAGLTTFWRVDSMDASGRVTKETLGNGATNEYTYTKGGRVRTIKSLGGAQTIQDFSYEYDKVANLASRNGNPPISSRA